MSNWLARLLTGLGLAGVVTGCSAPTIATPTVRATASQEEARGEVDASKKAEVPPPGEPFRLPTDEAGKLLGKVLPPDRRPGALHNPRRPPPAAPLPAAVAQPDTMPTAVAELTRLPLSLRKQPLRPDFLVDEQLDGAPLSLTVPREPSFAIPRPTRIDQDDVSLPPALPPMAVIVPDRVPVDDPTTEASLSSTLQSVPPRREGAAPFQRQSVPEPYEYRATIEIVVPEETVPAR